MESLLFSLQSFQWNDQVWDKYNDNAYFDQSNYDKDNVKCRGEIQNQSNHDSPKMNFNIERKGKRLKKKGYKHIHHLLKSVLITKYKDKLLELCNEGNRNSIQKYLDSGTKESATFKGLKSQLFGYGKQSDYESIKQFIKSQCENGGLQEGINSMRRNLQTKQALIKNLHRLAQGIYHLQAFKHWK